MIGSMSDPVGGWGIILGFVPLASAVLGAGATYAWQMFGDRRTDEAIRIQTDARLLELVTVAAVAYASGKLAPESLLTITRVAKSLDDVGICLALKRQPFKLVSIGLLRTWCEQLLALTAERIAAVNEEEEFPEKEQIDYLRGLTKCIVRSALLAMSTPSLVQFARESANTASVPLDD
jgi:hypothetical protein